jgi:hypothetical protein
MEWKIVINKKDRYVEIITSGIADKDGSLRMAKAITENMRKNRITRALIDHSNIEAVTGEVTDIYYRPNILGIIGLIMKIRIAEVIHPEHLEHFRFFETVCINQGYRISIFQEKDQALKWLLER